MFNLIDAHVRPSVVGLEARQLESLLQMCDFLMSTCTLEVMGFVVRAVCNSLRSQTTESHVITRDSCKWISGLLRVRQHTYTRLSACSVRSSAGTPVASAITTTRYKYWNLALRPVARTHLLHLHALEETIHVVFLILSAIRRWMTAGSA